MVLFLHGLGCSSDSFRNLFDKSYFPGKSLLLIDFMGFGSSAKPEGFPYTMESQAKAVEEVLSLFPGMKIHIAAHSMGGAIALLLSEKSFEQVLSFTNIEGNLIAEDCGILSRGIADLPYEKYVAGLYKRQIKEFDSHPQLRFDMTTPFVLHRSAVSLVEWSGSGKLLDKFLNLKCRKSYFYGEENSSMPVLDRMAGIEKVMISSAGHGMMTDNPDQFYTLLSQFINS